MRLRSILLAIVTAAGLSTGAVAEELKLKIELDDAGLALVATSNGKSTARRIDAQTATRLMAVRFSVECLVEQSCRYQKQGVFESERLVFDADSLISFLKRAGDEILGPLRNRIEASSHIRVITSSELLKLPIDSLYVSGKPLFLHKPIVYVLDDAVKPAKLTFGRASSAVLISDATSDPSGLYSASPRHSLTLKKRTQVRRILESCNLPREGCLRLSAFMAESATKPTIRCSSLRTETCRQNCLQDCAPNYSIWILAI
jgi:hypothetical protein